MGGHLLLLQNPFSITLLLISAILILLVTFSSRIHKISAKQHPNVIPCPKCNEKINRSIVDKKLMTCPFCHGKLVPNQKRLVCFYLGVIVLGLSFFLEKEDRWIFQLMYMVLTGIGFAMKEFEKPND